MAVLSPALNLAQWDNLSSWVKLGTMKVKCFAKNTKHAMTHRGLKVRALDMECRTLTIRPTCLPPDRPKDRESQRTKISNSPQLVDFAIGLVNSFFNLPDGQVMFIEEFK